MISDVIFFLHTNVSRLSTYFGRLRVVFTADVLRAVSRRILRSCSSEVILSNILSLVIIDKGNR